MKKFLIILLFGVALASCRTELEYNGPEGEPSLYVYALFDNDTLNYVFVGETTFFLDEPKNKCLSDAVVTLRVNGGEEERLRYDSDTALYVFEGKIDTGDTLWLTVQHSRLGSAESMAVVPPKLEVTTKEVCFDKKGVKYDNYAILEFSTADCRKTDGYYFTFKPYVTAEAYMTMYDYEHYNPITRQYGKEWDTMTCQCAYYSQFTMLAAEESVEENVDIWSLIYGGEDFVAYRFDMKEDNVECKVEFSMKSFQNCDSLRNVVFYALVDVYSKDYAEFTRQTEKARNESNNPFVEPTQVKGNIIPTGDTRYAFGCFSITISSGSIEL